MDITAQTTVHDFVDTYPFLHDWLVDYSSELEALKNPASFATMARVAKIETVALMAGVNTDKLLEDAHTAITMKDRRKADRRRRTTDSTMLRDDMPVELVEPKFNARIANAGHPIDSYRRENVVAARFIAKLDLALNELASEKDPDGHARALASISATLGEFGAIDTHYARKESQLFPALEAHGVEGPSKVMWLLDDEIRRRLKTARLLAAASDTTSLSATLPVTLNMVRDMIHKEERTLFPVALEVITPEEWDRIATGDAEMGYAWIDEPVQ